MRSLFSVLGPLVLAGLVCTGCLPGEKLSSEQLLDPAACADCHQEHYRQWSGSMHAYAAEDPVFLAMNQRGQEETNGELGDFCVRCHAPMAVRTGATTDGLNLADVAPELKGVTCAFCHRIDGIEEAHNALVSLGPDTDMRGGIADPVGTAAHKSIYSPLHDRNAKDSSAACGACHDVVTPAGLHLERTFAEWESSVFGSDGIGQLSCGNCHMRGKDGPITNDLDGPIRRVHNHTMVGVDLALTDFPETDEQAELTQDALDDVLWAQICVSPGGGAVEIQVTLENLGAGHFWPSGATQDRRAWVELIAMSGDSVLLESGVVPEGQAASALKDPHLWLLKEDIFDANGNPTHMFWEASSSTANVLPVTTSLDPTDPGFHADVIRTYVVATVPDRVTMRVQMRPMGLEVLDDLIDSGHLDAEVKEAMPTFELASTVLEWTGPLGSCVP